MSGPLRASHAVALTFERGVGGAVERLLRGLADAEILGTRTADGRVMVPPVDHDPVTGAACEEVVRVSDWGVLRSWTWVARPRPEHPLPTPFAFALVDLDGADTSLLHVVDVGDERELAVGMEVRADWRATRTGSIRDIRAFVPAHSSSVGPARGASALAEELTVTTDVHLEYTFEPGLTASDFYRALGEGRVEGGRCEGCGAVYVPPRSSCPACGTHGLTTAAVVHTGTVVSFTVVHLPVPGMELDLPFAWGWIRLDGADVPFPHLLGDVDPGDVRVGQRVEAVWAPAGERPSSWEAIRHFRPVPG